MKGDIELMGGSPVPPLGKTLFIDRMAFKPSQELCVIRCFLLIQADFLKVKAFQLPKKWHKSIMFLSIECKVHFRKHVF